MGPLILSLLIPGTLLLSSRSASNLLACLLIYFLGLFLLPIYSIFNEHIILTENEITFCRLGLEFKTRWGNIEAIGVFLFQEGLYIDKSKIKIMKWFLGTIETYMGLGQEVFIPLSFYSTHWRDSELGQQIKQYAPHLFEQKNPKSA